MAINQLPKDAICAEVSKNAKKMNFEMDIRSLKTQYVMCVLASVNKAKYFNE